MKVYSYTKETTLSGKRVIALGFFDGVHRGHREIIERAKEEAKRLSLPAAVFTFSGESFALKGGHIYPTKEKISVLEKMGVDEVILADFTEMREVSAENFVTDTLLDRLGCAVALSGDDFRFGKGAVGNVELLSSLLKENGASLICAEAVTENGKKISSTTVRELLKEGKIKEANKLLGSPYFIKSKVTRGLGLGKSFGFPTLNADFDERGVDILSGVYKCVCKVDGETHNAIANVGVCPTVSDRKKHIEAYLIGYSGDLYGKNILLEFHDFIRPEIKFNSKEELIKQIKVDINKTFYEKEI